MISARKAKHLEVTTMFTYSHANTPLGQSEGVYYLSYFRKSNNSKILLYIHCSIALEHFEVLYSWKCFLYSARTHWLLRGHMPSNNEAVSRQNF